MSRPRFTHDGCPRCVFLGNWEDHDLYFCPQNGMPTVLARYGDEGSHYLSGVEAAHLVPALGEAKRRAEINGLLP